MNPDDYFAMLESWKLLPAYKLETRVDSLIGYYLPDALQAVLGVSVSEIIPELPLRLGTIHPSCKNSPNRSFKVDFYALRPDGSHLLIELKSDSGSRREPQDDYLTISRDLGMTAVLEGIRQIAQVSQYKKKYDALKAALQGIGIVDAAFSPTVQSDEIQIVYVQPHKLDSDSASMVMGFVDLAEYIEQNHSDPFSLRFAASLRLWSND